ncbi:TPA: hypothetical protein ACQJI0_004493 [Citrobacter freundii]
MLRANLCRISYIPVFSIYAVLPVIHDVIPYHNGYYSEDWAALAGMYALGVLISLPLYYLLKKIDDKGVYKGALASVVRRALFSIFLQLSCLYFFWEKSAYLYLSISVVMGLSVAILTVGRKDWGLIKNAGNTYEVRDNGTYKLKDSGSSGYKTGILGKELTLVEISSGQFLGHDSDSLVQPINSDLSNADFKQDTVINPSSGMSMTGGISGLDIHGNSWGTNFNEPSNTYDPSRGY